MTGGWGAPRKRPPSNDPERPPKGPGSGTLANPKRTRAALLMNVITGHCNDGYHGECPGDLLGVSCCCECHA